MNEWERGGGLNSHSTPVTLAVPHVKIEIPCNNVDYASNIIIEKKAKMKKDRGRKNIFFCEIVDDVK